MDRQRCSRLPVGLATAVLLVSAPVQPSAAAPPGDFSYAQGWRVGQHPRELADVNGDGRADVVGFGEDGLYLSYSVANGIITTPTHPDPDLADFGHDQGWRVDRHPRELADVDGDGRADVIGFGDAGTHVSLAGREDDLIAELQPSVLVVADFGHDQGWRVDRHPRFVERTTSRQGADVVGLGDRGTYISFAGAGETLSAAWLAFEEFGRHQGWRVERHPRELGDVSGDGIPDVVGFGERRPVLVALLVHAVPPDVFENDPATGG